jgi:2-polyprenyl-3-methyl-5-hydroxy-6-metoxy-1,4-benzoquinol methylase
MAENVVDDYGWAGEAGPQSCGYIAPRVRDVLKQLGVRRVCDLGSGNGQLCAMLAASGFDVTGVEYDRQGVEIARRAHPGIRFHNLGVQDNPAELVSQEGLFEAVVSTEVIEHLFSPHLLPRFAHGCLKPGGHLVITTPYHGYLKNVALAVMNKWDHHHTALWHGGHIKFWSRRTLSELLEQNGFKVVGFSGVGRLPFLWKSMVVVAQRA